MKIHLDTTYLLPFLGIGIRELDRINDVLRYLFSSDHELIISKITIFEALAKGIKLCSMGAISFERILSGITFLEKTPRLLRIDFTYPEIIETTVTIRKYVSDTVDCIILASSFVFTDMLITEDSKILDFTNKNSHFKELNRLRTKPLQVVDLKGFIEMFKL